jgi:hypothetical protein
LETFLSLCVGVGLSAACGFRVFVPLLIMSIAAQGGHLELVSGFAWIGTPTALTAFAVASVCEVLAYYIPLVDNFLDAVATPAAVIAGTVVAASVVTGMSPFWTWSAAIIAGGGVAGATQTSTVAMRGTSTLTTAGFANPLVSTGELAGAVGTSLLAIAVPIVAAIVIGLFLLLGMGRLLRRKRA